MGDHQERAAGLCDEIEGKLQDLIACGLIEVARGLVSENKAGLARQGTSNGHPLLLPARELFGVALEQARESKPVDEFVLPLRIEAACDPRLKR
jgi:hypothetical protein